jgi:hypothetical protein
MRNGGGCVESSLAFVWHTGRADGDGRRLGDRLKITLSVLDEKKYEYIHPSLYHTDHRLTIGIMRDGGLICRDDTQLADL